MSGDTSRLAELVAPTSVREFHERYCGRSTLLSRGDDPGRFASLLHLDQVEAFVFDSNLREGQLQVSRNGLIDRTEYLYPSGLVDTVSVARLFDEGCSIVLPFAHQRIASLGVFVRGLEAELGCRAQANVYLSPSDESAFVPHFDSHDVFAVQAHGDKRWTLYPDPGPVPPVEQFDPERHPAGPETETFVLSQGDVCYLPTGIMHHATSEGVSLHITIGIHWVRVSDVLPVLVRRALEDQPDLHRVIPPDWWPTGPARDAAIGQVRDALAGVMDDKLISATLDRLREELVSTRQPLVPGQLSQLARVDDIDTTTVVAPRDPMIWDLKTDEDGATLSCFGSEISFPPEALTALTALLQAGTEGIGVGELDAELTVEEKLVLVRRLVREGVAGARW